MEDHNSLHTKFRENHQDQQILHFLLNMDLFQRDNVFNKRGTYDVLKYDEKIIEIDSSPELNTTSQ